MEKEVKLTEFQRRVLAVVRAIPRGEVLSYAQVAYRAGRPGAARAVGTLMKQNRDPDVPCHRVIKSDGTLGGYNGNLGEKEQLLREEGAIA
jgi:O-6-methylguanine DNA methyltransferase